MMDAHELNHIKCQERAALKRKHLAWLAYMSTKRRFEEADYLMLFALNDFEKAKDRLEQGCEIGVELEMAAKRHRAAQEELLYQAREQARTRAEFESARLEYQRWHTQFQQKLTENSKISVPN